MIDISFVISLSVYGQSGPLEFYKKYSSGYLYPSLNQSSTITEDIDDGQSEPLEFYNKNS